MAYCPTYIDEKDALREENARLRSIIKGAHGALTDAGSVVVPGTLEGDLAPAIRQLVRERDEARDALRVAVEGSMLRDADCDATILALRTERDEARAEVERQRTRAEDWRERFNSEAGLAGKRQLEAEEWQETARNEMVGRAAAEAKLARCVEALELLLLPIRPLLSDEPHERRIPTQHDVLVIRQARAALAATKGGE